MLEIQNDFKEVVDALPIRRKNCDECERNLVIAHWLVLGATWVGVREENNVTSGPCKQISLITKNVDPLQPS